jgi:hypothetical protein
MKISPDSDENAPLLDAVLKDENWAAASAALKDHALVCFRAHRRQRRHMALTACAAALVVLLISISSLLWPKHQLPTGDAIPSGASARDQTDFGLVFLSDSELLGMFPEGSCILAEIDGRTELVFLDPKVAREYFADPGSSGPR